MKYILVVLLLSLTGCALTPVQVAERAKLKSNTDLCMAMIQFPQYGDAVTRELAARGHTCDWTLAAAQVGAAEAADANRRAALQTLAASFNTQTQPTYQIVAPVTLQAAPSFQMQPIQNRGVTAMYTGRQKAVQTITGQYGNQCEYNYLGKVFTRVFTGICPSSVQVE